LTFDPGHLKHDLWAVRPETADDPALVRLFQDTQTELDRQLTMLSDIGSSEFLYGSLQLYGGVEPDLLALAESILDRSDTLQPVPGPVVSARELCELAADEVRNYRSEAPDFGPLPRVSEETYGLIVTQGQLMIGADVSIPSRRVDALIQHEVGTHMLTYYNGSAQPLHLLAAGLPGYEETQEGLSVLAEYLTDGLDVGRLRILAGRVIAIGELIDGAGFVEAFRQVMERGFSPKAAFSIVTQIYRGGGLTKGAIYLRGLAGILLHVGNGGEFTRLFLGKLSADQLPVIEELLAHGILVEPRVLPRYLRRTEARERLQRLTKGMDVLQLIDESRGQHGD
jgi:uncharacterized protein (TIGR02421 family)